jgi:membrane-bound lytic murein transglycosylase D
MLRFLNLLLCVIVLGCSSAHTTRSDSTASKNNSSSLVVSKVASASTGAVMTIATPSMTNDTAASTEADTLQAKNGANGHTPADTSENDTEQILQNLEQARQHYLLALASQDAGDSISCQTEFETAISILNELGDFPGIDSSKEYLDLSKNLIDDYEKYIAEVDSLGPDASVYALREKLNSFVEQGDTTGLGIPKLEIKGTQVPLPLNEYVERAEAFFMGRGRHYMERWLYLGGKYCPMMKRIFKEEGTPEELAYLSMPESGLRPDARSWARAVGLWQFMKGTGAMYGLRSNWWYDERRDFEKSTRAAARHLKDLYSDLGDWNLVLGAYNAGAGRIYRAIRRSGSHDFWEMKSCLPKQTRGYIPQYIAVARIVLNPEAHGFTNIEKADSLAFDVVEVNDCVDLRVLAKCAQTSVDTLQELNPELLRWCTPPGVTGYRFRIPVGTKDTFLVRYAQIPQEQKKDWAIHTVRRGETVSSIARKYGLATDFLKDVNNIKTSKRLSIGTTLAIPIPRDIADSKEPFDYSPAVKGMNMGAAKAYAERKEKASSGDSRRSRSRERQPVRQPKGREKLVYHVKHGDTMGHIAEWYGVRASDIRNWNDIAYGRYIHAGQALTIWVPSSKVAALKKIDSMEFSAKQSLAKGDAVEATPAAKTPTRKKEPSSDWIQHKVKRGETLEKIARTYEVSIEDLKQWNHLASSKIKYGQTIKINDKSDEHAKPVADVPPVKHTVPVKTSSKGIFSSTHKVKKGETISTIAKQYGVAVTQLKKENGLRKNKIVVGQTLKIPSKSQSAVPTTKQKKHSQG